MAEIPKVLPEPHFSIAHEAMVEVGVVRLADTHQLTMEMVSDPDTSLVRGLRASMRNKLQILQLNVDLLQTLTPYNFLTNGDGLKDLIYIRTNVKKISTIAKLRILIGNKIRGVCQDRPQIRF